MGLSRAIAGIAFDEVRLFTPSALASSTQLSSPEAEHLADPVVQFF